jgi:succinate-semialdehyde dehydrogenase / glutarate-semialdehyde dehydrogenase
MTLDPALNRGLSMVPDGMPIGGEWRRASGDATFPIEDPATLEELRRVPDATVEDGVAALDAAAEAQGPWAATAPRERSELLRAVYAEIMEERDALAALMTAEMGKPLEQSRGEVAYAADFFRWFSEEAVRIEGRWSVAPAGTHHTLVLPQPVGPSLLITPWNFPLAMGARKIAPALAAGCTAILKPAPQTPLSSLALAAILERVGVPSGAVNVVPTSDAAGVVAAVLADSRLRKLSFTGSTPVGKLLLRGAADNVLRTSMELGGNAPFIVCEDADLDVAVEGAMLAKLRNMGEACTAANRVYVHDAVADRFVGAFSERMAEQVVGSGFDPKTDVGPLIDQAAVDKVARLREDALARGASVVAEGAGVPDLGYFTAPQVLMDVPEDADMSCEEIFGPVAAVHRFTDDDAAIAAANDTVHGLVAYVFTQDRARGRRYVMELETGMVGLNRGLVSDPAAPFGGIKQSGVGREGSHEGLAEFLELKYVAEA